MNSTHLADLTSAVADLVVTATDGLTDTATARQSARTFADYGMSSLSFLRLIDALEITYGVEIDLETDLDAMRTVASIVDYLTARGVR